MPTIREMTSKHSDLKSKSKSASPGSRLPVQIDPIRLAKSRQILSGKLPLKSCKRLISLSNNEGSGSLQVDVEFGVDNENIHYCTGEITGELELTCQRCLETLKWPVKVPVKLAFVNNDFEAENLKGDYESHILDSVPLVMSDIIEDELLLAMPQVPMHPESECPASKILNELESGDTAGKDEAEQQADNPFAALASLQKQHD